MSAPTSPRDHSLSALVVCVLVAAGGFGLLFSGVVFHFWWQMALTVGALCALAWALDSEGMAGLFRVPLRPLMLLLGVLSAAALYGVFYVGNAAVRAAFDFTGGQIDSVYGLRENAGTGLIVLLLAFVIGPGEEVFWRGYVQRRLVARWGGRGFGLSVLAYGLVHVASGNATLVAAALVCGVFWGALFVRFRSIWLNIVSHVLWDLATFVWLPFASGGQG